jgi:hypothetical protein
MPSEMISQVHPFLYQNLKHIPILDFRLKDGLGIYLLSTTTGSPIHNLLCFFPNPKSKIQNLKLALPTIIW